MLDFKSNFYIGDKIKTQVIFRKSLEGKDEEALTQILISDNKYIEEMKKDLVVLKKKLEISKKNYKSLLEEKGRIAKEQNDKNKKVVNSEKNKRNN